MKISNSKKDLARIISENGGWSDGAEFAAQDKGGDVFKFDRKPVMGVGREVWMPAGNGRADKLCYCATIKGWHQAILSRAEYFHLYPAPDADGWIEWGGGECPVGEGDLIDVKLSDGDEFFDVGSDWDWGVDAGSCNIIAYRLHKPEQSMASKDIKVTPYGDSTITIGGDPMTAMRRMQDSLVFDTEPTIEQLVADYRNAKDYAEHRQQEADAAKADAGEKLRVLEIAGEAHGLLLSPITANKEPELVITDWRDLQAGDVISVSGKWWEPDSEYTVDDNDGSRDAPIRVGDYWAFIGECSFKFIRRP